VALTGSQATGATAGPRLLGRLAAAMFELDRWIPAHSEDLQAAARERSRGAVEVQGLPVRATVNANSAIAGDGEAMSREIASSAGHQLYELGRAAFRDENGAAAGSISISEPARWAVSSIEEDNHRAWNIALGATLVAVLFFSLLSLLTSSGASGVTVAIAAGALLATIGAAVLWGLATLCAGAFATQVDREVARMLRDCAWMGIRIGLAVAAAGIALTLMLRLVTQTDRHYAEWPGALDEPA
jgi:hypothetical protein